jgi:hypothetical protein
VDSFDRSVSAQEIKLDFSPKKLVQQLQEDGAKPDRQAEGDIHNIKKAEDLKKGNN